jgi:hypothetical protein
MAPVSKDLAWAIVRMMPVLHINSVSAFTSVSHRKIYQILALYHSTGAVIKHQDTRMLGCLRHLTPEDVAVSDNFSFYLGSNIYMQFLHGSLDKNCDLYLDELRQSLKERCGISVSLPTVWRALNRSGYTMKRVMC